MISYSSLTSKFTRVSKQTWQNKDLKYFILRISIALILAIIIGFLRKHRIEPFNLDFEDSWLVYYTRVILIFCCNLFLKSIGQQSYTDYQAYVIGITDYRGVWLGIPCLAYKLMGIYTLLIISYPGKLKHKLWYIPMGLIIIQILNILRLSGIALVIKYYPEYVNFDHHYLFTYTVYVFVFILWVVWMRSFGSIKLEKS